MKGIIFNFSSFLSNVLYLIFGKDKFVSGIVFDSIFSFSSSIIGDFLLKF
jgi:hypothetical protein